MLHSSQCQSFPSLSSATESGTDYDSVRTEDMSDEDDLPEDANEKKEADIIEPKQDFTSSESYGIEKEEPFKSS